MATIERQGEEGVGSSKTKRVIMENKDGTVTYLDGADLTLWEKTMSGLVSLGFIHGKQGQKELSEVKWKKASSLKDIDTSKP